MCVVLLRVGFKARRGLFLPFDRNFSTLGAICEINSSPSRWIIVIETKSPPPQGLLMDSTMYIRRIRNVALN